MQSGPVTIQSTMLLSKSCEYGLRASLYLSTLDESGFVPIRTIAAELDIEFHFLTKIFRQLTEAGLMHSQRGPKGGIALAQAPERITLLEIVVAIDGEDLFEECVLGLPGCGDRKPCPMHERWAVERGRVKRMFDATTLAEAAEEIKNGDLRLAILPGDLDVRSSS